MVFNNVADDGDSWWAIVYAVMELRIQYNAEIILIILCLVEFLRVELLLAEEHKLKIHLFYSKISGVFGPFFSSGNVQYRRINVLFIRVI